MNDELIRAVAEIEVILGPDGYYVGTTHSDHAFAGRTYYIEVEMLIGSLCQAIAAVCAKYDVTFRVTGKGRNALINVSYF
jgi:hypothetical protein